jgi:uncharacterized protein YjiS (DUF1127 family)
MSEMHSFGSVNRARRNNIPSGEEIRFALRDKRDVAHEKLTRFPGPDLEHDEIRSNGDREGTALPLAGRDERSSLLEGWGRGAAAIHAVRVERVSPTRIASSDAMRLPPQAGEVQQVRGQADSTKNHPAIADLNSLPDVTPSMAAGRQKTTVWSPVIRSFMEDFALYGTSVHLTACFPVTLHSDEEKILRARDISARTISPGLERNTNQATPAGPAAAFADNSLRELNDVKSPRIGRSNRWNWLTLPWEVVVTLWTHGRREREIRRAVAALAELDDRTLRDIGIPHRSHIEQVVRYCHDC